MLKSLWNKMSNALRKMSLSLEDFIKYLSSSFLIRSRACCFPRYWLGGFIGSWFFFFFPLSPRDQMRITQQPAQCTLLRYVQSSSSEQTACKLHTSVCGFLWWKKEKKSFWLSFTEVRVRVVAHSNNNGQQRVLCDLISSVSLAIWAIFVSFFHLRRLTFGFKSEYIGTQTQASKDAA